MFLVKNCIKIITIDNEIKVVGLSLEKFGYPKKAEKIGDMWGAYEKNYRMKAENVKVPVLNYGFWYNKPDKDYDYLVGSAVTDFKNIDAELTPYVIPAGKYIKASFNAKDFTDLVCGSGISDSFKSAKKYAEDNSLKIRQMPVFPVGAIEVYPHELLCVGKENGPEWGIGMDIKFITPSQNHYPEMFTLTAVE